MKLLLVWVLATAGCGKTPSRCEKYGEMQGRCGAAALAEASRDLGKTTCETVDAAGNQELAARIAAEVECAVQFHAKHDCEAYEACKAAAGSPP